MDFDGCSGIEHTLRHQKHGHVPIHSGGHHVPFQVLKIQRTHLEVQNDYPVNLRNLKKSQLKQRPVVFPNGLVCPSCSEFHGKIYHLQKTIQRNKRVGDSSSVILLQVISWHLFG